jgi:hypothetical protein
MLRAQGNASRALDQPRAQARHEFDGEVEVW